MASSTRNDIVGDDEYLIRELCDPDHIDKNGKIKAAAIQLIDLRLRGASVHRRDITGIDFIKKAVRNRCENHPGQDWKECVALFRAKKVRAIKHQDRNVFCVISEPEDNNPGHASIYFNSSVHGEPKNHARKMRKRLLPLLQNYMSVDAAFEIT